MHYLFIWWLLSTLIPLNYAAETLVWYDEFDTLDQDRWYHFVTTWDGGNGEFNYYRNSRSNSYIENGVLHLKPTLTTDEFGEGYLTEGGHYLEGCTVNGNCTLLPVKDDIVFPVAGVRISTERSFNFGYNHKVKIRAKMPRGDWIWPYILLLPKDSVYGVWPRSGAISIVESRGNHDLVEESGKPIGVNRMVSVLHYGPRWLENMYRRTLWNKTLTKGDFSEEFHDYEFEWTTTYLRFSVDGEEIGKAEPPNGDFWNYNNYGEGEPNPWEHRKMAPFDQKFHFILNLNVGGTNGFWGDNQRNGRGPKPWKNNAQTPKKDFWDKKDDWYPTWDNPAMRIDYIRVYRL